VQDFVPAYDDPTVTERNSPLRALCVARHPYLSDHFARFFAGLGVETKDAAGLGDALAISRVFEPHLIICEYELLVTLSLEALERDELLSRTPVIAVSLTRRPHESHVLDVNGIGGFLYLPSLDADAAMRILSASASRPHYTPAPVSSLAVEETV
jgi:hypothetical protein